MNTPTLQVDHLVFVAPSLAEGLAWCEHRLGVTPGPGGRHALMGTHNRLARLATPAFPTAYLEIIAIDPEAVPPTRARWFGMDRPRDGVQLVHAVFSTTQLDDARHSYLAAGCDPGPGISAERQTEHGPLRWTLTVRDDGAVLCGGALPTLIAWQGRHPTERMADSGLALQTLTLRGLPEALLPMLRTAGVDAQTGGTPALSARLSTPRGDLVLHSA